MLWLAAAGGLAACGGGAAATALPPLALQTANPDLRAAAAHVLTARGASLRAQAPTPLRLREASAVAVDALAADGSVGAHRLQYTLWFAAGDDKERRIDRFEVIDNNANAYWASAAERTEAVAALRQDALAQMAYLLESEAAAR